MKYVPAEERGALAEGGLTVLGENRAQDLQAKVDRHPAVFTWDFIGHVQSRKVKQIAPLVRLIHSVSTDSVLRQLERHAPAGLRVLVEVNTWVHRAFMRYSRGQARLSNHADLKSVARLQLQAAGVAPERIHDCDICTMCAPRSLFHSHRRDHGNDPRDTGRQASAVWRVAGDQGGDWPS